MVCVNHRPGVWHRVNASECSGSEAADLFHAVSESCPGSRE